MNRKECLVLNCTRSSGKGLDGGKFYSFPIDEEERRKWLVKCGREPTYDSSLSFVCSRHFCSDDFETTLVDNLLTCSLKRGVVPHLNVIEIKQETFDSDDCEYDGQLLPTTCSPKRMILKTEVENSFFEPPATNEDEPIAGTSKTIPLESIQVNSSSPVINTVSSSSAVFAPSSLPASQNWPGSYDFTVTFDEQEKTTKGVSWTYSKLKDKLYVGKDAPCPINFSVKVENTTGFLIRCTALYSSPEHASEVVHRCVNHSTAESNKGVFEAKHLVRCESQRATYEEDRTTKRHSVLVPFENPPVGQLYSTYLYKFTCFGSCAGGPNRRPLMLIFSLEKSGNVLGRRKLDVKICACPGRDRKSEEKPIQTKIQPEQRLPVKRKAQDDLNNLGDTMYEFTKDIYLPPAKKVKPNKNGFYVLHVPDAGCYEFLKNMKKFYEMCKAVSGLPPSVKSLLMNPALMKNGKKSGSENEESESEQ